MPWRGSKPALCLVLFIVTALINALFIRNDVIWGVLSLSILAGSSQALALAFGSRGLSEWAPVVFMALTSQILALGYSLSGLNRLGSTSSWFAGSVFLGALLVTAARVYNHRKPGPGMGDTPGLSIGPRAIAVALMQIKAETSRPKVIILTTLLVTLLIVCALNLFVVLSTPPGNWDSLTYHAARVAYYIQHGNLEPYPANYWAQTLHPKNATVLVIYAYLMSGRNENMMQIVQFVAWCIAIICIYGICRRMSITRAGSLFAASSFGLLTEVLMESTTVQNDLLLAAYAAIMVHSLLAFGRGGHGKDLGLFAAALGIAVGIKASALLVMPSVLLLLVFVLRSTRNDGQARRWKAKRALYLAAVVGVSLLLFTLPSGYLDNYRQYKHPLGPAEIRQMHTFEKRGLAAILTSGGKNALRYGIDFANLDGLPRLPIVSKVNTFVRSIPIRALEAMSIRLVEPGDSRRPYDPGRLPSSHEDHAYWGILGFALILPGVALVLFGVVRSHPVPRLLGLAFLVFIAAQSFSGPYDPWRGRYFIAAGVFAVPIAGYLFDQLTKRASLAYVTLIACLGSVSALSAICFRDGRQLLPFDGNKSIVSMNRLERMTVRRPFMYDIVANYERLVPASASVGLLLGDNEGEYLFFGEKATRKLVPLRWRAKVPPGTQFVVFQGQSIPVLRGDVDLGRGWYLRRLQSP